MVGARKSLWRHGLRGAGDHLAKWPALLAKWSPVWAPAAPGTDSWVIDYFAMWWPRWPGLAGVGATYLANFLGLGKILGALST
jgi:hypothetical protein